MTIDQPISDSDELDVEDWELMSSNVCMMVAEDENSGRLVDISFSSDLDLSPEF